MCPGLYSAAMPTAVGAILALAFALGLVGTLAARALGRRLGALDGPGVPGQVKPAARRVPNTGGMGIVLGVVGPLGLALLAAHVPAWQGPLERLAPGVGEHLGGLRGIAGGAAVVLACVLALHALGVVDDRRPLGAMPKLAVILAASGVISAATGTRLLELLDPLAGGSWASWALTVLWIAAVTNAMNFIDNMDGLAAGVGAIAGACLLGAALSGPEPQWFVAAALAALVGACGGFLVFNGPWPRASVFMGDGGSLVVGLLLGFLTVRSTYVLSSAAAIDGLVLPGALGPIGSEAGARPGRAGVAWHGVLVPVVVLAVPLYDMASVCLIRIWQGRSPFVGDMQHLSHRLERRGLSKRMAVVVIWGLTAITGLGGVLLPGAEPARAWVIGAQAFLALAVLAAFERFATGGPAAAAQAPPGPAQASQPGGGHARAQTDR